MLRPARVLGFIKRRFGSKGPAIDRVFEGDGSFRSLCAEYLACTRALAYWQESDAEEADRRAAEYSELIEQLTGEIQARLCAAERAETAGSEAENTEPPNGE